MKNKIIVFEPNMNSPAHTEVNAGLLSMIQDIYIDNNLTFIADEKHYESLAKKIPLDNWKYENVKIFPYSPKYFIINEFLLSLRLIKIIILNKNTDTIFLLGILPISHIALSIMNKYFNKNIIIALHGQMEAYLPNTMIGRSKYYYLLSKNVFKKNDNLRYLVFGKSIQDNIKFLFPNNKNIIIDQPYLFSSNKKLNIKPLKIPIVLAVIGRADKGKNIKQLFSLIDLLEKEIDDGLVEIKIIGKLSFPIDNKYEKYLTYYREAISNEVFDLELSNVDFSLSFTDENFYRATPSGVLFDCIKWNIPVLGLKNDYITYYFQNYGEFGRLFPNVHGMANYIRELIVDNNNYNSKKVEMDSAFQKLKEEISLESLKKKIKAQL